MADVLRVRFPEASEATLSEALKKADGHAGRAAAALRKAGTKEASEPSGMGKSVSMKVMPSKPMVDSGLLEGMRRRFPDAPDAAILDEFKKAGDHAGKVATALRKAGYAESAVGSYTPPTTSAPSTSAPLSGKLAPVQTTGSGSLRAPIRGSGSLTPPVGGSNGVDAEKGKLKEQLARAESQLALKEAEARSLKDRLAAQAAAPAEVQSLREQLAEAQGQVAQERAQRAAEAGLQRQLEEAQAQLAAAQSQRQAASASEAEVKRLKDQLAEARGQAAKERAQRDTEVGCLQQQLAETQRQLLESQAQLAAVAAASRAAEDVPAGLEDLQREIEIEQARAQAAEAVGQAAQTAATVLQEELQGLQKQLADKEAELSMVTKALSKAMAEKRAAAPAAEAAGQADARLAEKEAELVAVRKQLQAQAANYEQEIDNCTHFWKNVAQTSATATLGKSVDLNTVEWLGAGNYGQVFKCRHSTKRTVVVKLLGIRWAHVAAKEWEFAEILGEHEHIMGVEQVVLHGDQDHVVETLLRQGYEQGALKSKKRITKFPERYICFILRFMNRGTVQNWLDRQVLLPGGMFVILQKVALALAFMHTKGFTHNDVKPENILLSQDGGARSEVVVKLGDLGLAKRSRDRDADFEQFGMTLFCMATGARFGAEKFDAGRVDALVDQVAEVATHFHEGCDPSDRVAMSIRSLPELLRKVFTQELTMHEVAAWPALQDWSFFDGEVSAEEEQVLTEAHQSKQASAGLRSSQVGRAGTVRRALSIEHIEEISAEAGGKMADKVHADMMQNGRYVQEAHS